MDAPANERAGSMDVISMDVTMVWAWMRWPMSGLVAWTLPWFGHGCTGQWMGWQHELYHGQGNADLRDRASGANEGDGASLYNPL